MLWFLLACGPQRQTWAPPDAAPEPDAFLVDDDFGCFRDTAQVGRAHFWNVLGDDAGTLAAASGQVDTYPVGTVVQLAPIEAMVKRHEGFSPETGDWEFFKLAVVRGETVIVERGTTEIGNIAGGCAECHAPAAASNDWVCADSHGCDPLPGWILKKAAKDTQNDPRCE
jgi:hypothetical protein